MRVLTECPESHVAEWNFSLFGVPVHVKFWFWISVLLLCGEPPPAVLAIWVTVCFTSILLHELGHVFAFRMFCVHSEVVLYGWGGMAVPYGQLRGAGPRVIVSLAGPAAGFVLAGVVLLVARIIGAQTVLGFHMFLPTIAVAPNVRDAANFSPYTYLALNDLLFINFYWGLVNLLPVWPLDGGQATRALFEHSNHWAGRRQSLVLSALVAAGVAVWGIFEMNVYLALMFGILAVSSLQCLEGERSWMPRRSRSWR